MLFYCIPSLHFLSRHVSMTLLVVLFSSFSYLATTSYASLLMLMVSFTFPILIPPIDFLILYLVFEFFLKKKKVI
jgi:hypothetical protein